MAVFILMSTSGNNNNLISLQNDVNRSSCPQLPFRCTARPQQPPRVQKAHQTKC